LHVPQYQYHTGNLLSLLPSEHHSQGQSVYSLLHCLFGAFLILILCTADRRCLCAFPPLLSHYEHWSAPSEQFTHDLAAAALPSLLQHYTRTCYSKVCSLSYCRRWYCTSSSHLLFRVAGKLCTFSSSIPSLKPIHISQRSPQFNTATALQLPQ